MARSDRSSSRTSSRNLVSLAYGPVFGRTGAGGFGFGVKAVRAGTATAAAPFPAAAIGAFLTGFSAGFLAGGAAGFFGGAAFFAARALFLAAGTGFFAALAAAGFLAAGAAAFLVAAEPAFLAAGAVARLEVVAAFFTTGAAFFFERTGRFLAEAPTLEEADFFPEDVDAEREVDTLLTWVPLLAGVIVPSLGPRRGGRYPTTTSPLGAGDDTGPRRQGQSPDVDAGRSSEGAGHSRHSSAGGVLKIQGGRTLVDGRVRGDVAARPAIGLGGGRLGPDPHERVGRLHVLVHPPEDLAERATESVALPLEAAGHALDVGRQ